MSHGVDTSRVKKTYSFLRTPQPRLLIPNTFDIPATEPSFPFDPESISGITMWLPDEDAYITHSSNLVSQWSDKTVNAHNVLQTPGNQPTRLPTGGPTGGVAIDFFSPNYLVSSPWTALNVFAVGAKTMLVVFNIDTFSATTGTFILDPHLAGCLTGAWGLVVSSIAGVPTLTHYNNDGTEDVVQLTIMASKWYAACLRHDGTQIKLKLYGGSEVVTASGNTTSLANEFRIGVDFSDYVDGKIITMITYNVAITDTQRDALLNGAADKWNL